MADLADLADAAAERERDAGVARICAALARHRGATDCAECGEEIEPERLAAVPSARLCVGCRTEFERRRPMRAR